MADKSRIVLKHGNLDALILAFGSKSALPIAQVGIFGSDTPRYAGSVSEKTGKVKSFTVHEQKSNGKKKVSKVQTETTNAEVGAAHEFGSINKKLPKRSWLRTPITEHLMAYLQKSGQLNRETIKQVIEDRSIRKFMKTIGEIAEKVIQDGFSTAGFGKWAQWKSGKYQNNTGQILIDSGRLSRAVNSRVKSGK